MATQLEKLQKNAEELFKEQKFKEIIELLPDDELEKNKDAQLYAWRSRAGYLLHEDADKILYYAQKAIDADGNYFMTYHARGNAWRVKGEYDKAIADYTKAIKLKPDAADSYLNRGVSWAIKSEYDKAIADYNKAINLNIHFPPIYTYRALAYFYNKDYAKSRADYEKYISLPDDKTDTYFVQHAKDRIEELRKLIKTPSFKIIADKVDEIKKVLRFEDNCITHYTQLTIAKLLILDGSLFRLSEGAFLNDTSEGRELFKYLKLQFTSKTTDNTQAELFAKKPFIGSFVSENKHNNLTLWRMYGKEGKEEAKGCAITIDRNIFTESIRNKLIPDKTNEAKTNDELQFYRVAYNDHEQKAQFVIPGADKEVENELNKLMTDLYSNVEHYNKTAKKNIEAKKNLEEKLNEIAYLFKSAEYQHENEVRLVIKGIGFEKIVDKSFEIPRVYIELVSMRPLIKKITLGPKVEKADEWASAFFYNLDKDEYNPEIFISHLPFK